MHDSSIILTGALALAAFKGTKTQLRCPLKPQPPNEPQEDLILSAFAPGSILWVKEKWAAHWMYDDVPPNKARSTHPDDNFWYLADPEGTPGTHGCPGGSYIGRWRSALYMPRWASRFSIEITSVRLERLHSISENDVCAELGLSPITRDYKRPIFLDLWNTMHGKKAPWGSNPWVFRYEFRKVGA